MDDRLSKDLSLQEAVDVLRQQWKEGKPNLSLVASMLGNPSESSLLRLVSVDAEMALRAGEEVRVEHYFTDFPQLEPYRETLEIVLSTAATRNSSDEVSRAEDHQNLFSNLSLAPTLDHPSGQLRTKPNEQKPSIPPGHTYNLPQTIGNFVIEKYIGQGGFGLVLQGRDKRLGRRVAIKIKDKVIDKGLSDDFLHEARSICRLEHPSIVRLLQADETEEGIGYLVYEYVDGETLDKRVVKGDYSITECVDWIASIADALDYAHRRGIIHRDVSPRNIMITSEGTARLLDFGLSSIDNTFYVDDSQRILGTPNFMSPEQASGNPHWATSYADLFSLGSVLYYALTQKPAFAGSSTFDVLERVQKASPASPRSIKPEIPVKLEIACLQALAKEPQSRFSTGADMSAAILNSLGTPLPNTAPKGTRTTFSLLAAGVLLTFSGLGITLSGLSIFPKLTTEIESFDIYTNATGGSSKSIIENQTEKNEFLSKPFPLTFEAREINKTNAKLYICNYSIDDESDLKLKWQSREVDGTTTTLEKKYLRPGPNLILFVHSDKKLPAATDAPPGMLHDDPFYFEDDESEPSRARFNNTTYLFLNNANFKHVYTKNYVVRNENAVRFSTLDKKYEKIREIGEKWQTGEIYFRKGDFQNAAYVGIAFWISFNDEGAE